VGYFALASARPLREVADAEQIEALELDPSTAAEIAVNSDPRGSLEDYRAALARLKSQRSTWALDTRDIQLLPGGLFRADLSLPASAPTGTYTAEIFVFRSGKLAAKTESDLTVQRIGLERSIHQFAFEHSFFYGLGVVFLALASGWLASLAFRRF
jgi:uncharacterized protein (TIGR02186 family)